MAPHVEDSIAEKLAETYVQDKHNSVDVNVAEIELGSPTEEFERLTMLSPTPSIRHHHPHHDLAPLPKFGKRHDLPRASSPTGSVRSSFSSHRHVSRGTRRSIGFKRSYSHRSEASRELTIQAESEFVALIELSKQQASAMIHRRRNTNLQ